MHIHKENICIINQEVRVTMIEQYGKVTVKQRITRLLSKYPSNNDFIMVKPRVLLSKYDASEEEY